jgi:Cys-tRNA(Pro)/Cys-tRNA(Cys) deacylase
MEEERHHTVEEFVSKQGIDAEIIDLGTPMKTAASAAEVLRAPLGSIFKSIVLVDGKGRAVVAVLPGDRRVKLKRLAELAGTKGLSFAKPDLVLRVTGYPAGGTPPLGYKEDLAVFVDQGLLEYEVGYGGGGRPELLLKITPSELIRATGAVVGDIGE